MSYKNETLKLDHELTTQLDALLITVTVNIHILNNTHLQIKLKLVNM